MTFFLNLPNFKSLRAWKVTFFDDFYTRLKHDQVDFLCSFQVFMYRLDNERECSMGYSVPRIDVPLSMRGSLYPIGHERSLSNRLRT